MAGLKVSDLYNAIQAEIAPVKSAPVPDLASPETTPDILNDYIVKSNQAKYKEAKLQKDIANAMSLLSDAELRAFYNKCKGPKVHPSFTEDELVRLVRQNIFTNGFSESLWGHPDKGPVLAAYDELFSDKQETLEQINKGLAGNSPFPDSPEFNGKLEAEPNKQLVEDLKKELADPKDPEKTQRNNALLDEAAECLKVVDPQVREYFDRLDNSVNQYKGPGIQVAQELMKGVMVQEGLKTLGNGKYTGYLEPKNTNGGVQYIADDDSYWSKKKPFTQQAQDELGKEDVKLSDNTVNAVENITKAMDTLEYTNYIDNQKDHRFQYNSDPDSKYYAGEHGTKYYTFWPLINAKHDVLDAVKSKNIDSIRVSVDKYKKIDAQIQRMIDETKKEGIAQTNYFSGNVNSTRSDNPNMPAKYVTDFTAQNKINSIYGLYGFSKNTGISVKDVLTDPVKSLKKGSKTYVEINGMNSRKGSIGKKLSWGMQPMDANLKWGWMNAVGQLGRGIQGVLGMESDTEKRNKYAAAVELGKYGSLLDIQKETELYQAVEDISKANTAENIEKLDCIYSHAAIQSPEEFDLKKMIQSMTASDKNQWRSEYDINNKFAGNNIFSLDFRKLKTRPQDVISEFEEAQQSDFTFKNNFDKNRFLLSSFAAYSKIIKNAPDDVRGNADFIEFKNNVMKMHELADDPDTKAMLKAGAQMFDEAQPLNTLTRGKEDRFWGSKSDSQEYTDMKNSLKAVQQDIKEIRGEGTPPYGKNRKSFSEKISEAKEYAFKYARLKLDNGKKTKFSEKSGEDRFNESLATINHLTRLQKEHGFLSPAQEAYEQARMELLLNCHDKAWMRENSGRVSATMLYAKSLADAGTSNEYQKTMLRSDIMQKEINNLQQMEPSRSLIFGPPQDKAAELILTGAPRYKNVQEVNTAQVKERYDRFMEPREYADAVKKVKHKYAFGKAMQQMGIVDTADIRLSVKNKELQRMADKIEEDPEFQTTMDHLIKVKGKTTIMTDATSSRPSVLDPMPGYAEAQKSLEYKNKFVQRMCEELVIAQNPTGYKDGKKPEINKLMFDMYKNNKGISDFIVKMTEGKSVEQMENMTKELDDPKKMRHLIISYNKMEMESRQKPQPKKGPALEDPADLQAGGGVPTV